MEETPRSSVSAFGTPRDDRFFSPREHTLTRTSRSSSSRSASDDWITPRQDSFVGGNAALSSDGEFQTPRTIYDYDSQGLPTPYGMNKYAHNQPHRATNYNGAGDKATGKANEYYENRSGVRSAYVGEDKYSGGQGRAGPLSRGGGSGQVTSGSMGMMGAGDEEYGYVDPERGGRDRGMDRDSRDRDADPRSGSKPLPGPGAGAGVGPRSAAGSDYKGDEGEYPYEQEQDVQGYGEMSEQDVTDIFSFARHGRCEEIERLFNRGLPADVRDEFGNTLLIIACQNGNKRVAKLVLRRGANINARNYKGNTPLHYCFHYGYGDTLGQYLISKGADESARNNAGKPCWDGI